MSEKFAVCKRCNTGGLKWRESAKGKWYLYDPMTVSTSHGGSYVIPKAHQCPVEYDEQGNAVGIKVKMHPDEMARIMKEHNESKERGK
jgi:hypothetical protein